MPGVLILESMAQAAALLSFATEDTGPDEDSVYYFVGIDGARFKRPVEPGDQLIVDVDFDRSRGGVYRYSCQARVGETLACEAQLMCTMRSL